MARHIRGLAAALTAAVTVFGAATRGAPADAKATAREVLEAAGVRGGLVVHVGCGDGRLTVALRANDSYLVHGLDAEAANVAKARETVRAAAGPQWSTVPRTIVYPAPDRWEKSAAELRQLSKTARDILAQLPGGKGVPLARLMEAIGHTRALNALARLESAGAAVIAEGQVRTYDLGGTNTSLEVTEVVAGKL